MPNAFAHGSSSMRRRSADAIGGASLTVASAYQPLAAPLLVCSHMSVLAVVMMLLVALISGCTTTHVESPMAQPAALPASIIAPDQRVLAYPHGRWLLYGDGRAASPYAWVWVPVGATPPPPALPAR